MTVSHHFSALTDHSSYGGFPSHGGTRSHHPVVMVTTGDPPSRARSKPSPGTCPAWGWSKLTWFDSNKWDKNWYIFFLCKHLRFSCGHFVRFEVFGAPNESDLKRNFRIKFTNLLKPSLQVQSNICQKPRYQNLVDSQVRVAATVERCNYPWEPLW